MMTIVVDHNIEGQAMLLVGTLSTEGWLEKLDSTWRTIWAQVGSISHRKIDYVYRSKSP